ncbi:PDZ domain-containing protein [Heliorestis acidaminivorans]|uniref:PDZ domain-containing protein n=1 Tax=Heliorestis acidaminivorans TaxID=553427 RepID=A0A6I0F2R4_9FIRM|nr:trypsin-like peptidase domain-containing protein [Heliorestis acidaminivorans]KAB2953850.1 PDZ domain-containing protein [Heliorestis acidaminivorans]
MGHFEEQEVYRKKRQPGLLSYFLVALLSAILGGYFSLFFFGLTDRPDPEAGQPPQGGIALPAPDLSLAKHNSDSQRIVEVARQVGPAVVGIANRAPVRGVFWNQRVEEVGNGSGVIYDQAGFIVTNHHVVADATEIIVTLADGRSASATLIGSDRLTDLAVLKIDLDNLPVASFGDSDRVSVGELAIAIGNPGGREFAGSVTSGIVSGLNRQLNTPEGYAFNLIQTDAAINPGNSGGALFNALGEVIGINSIKIAIPGFEGMGFAIPSNQVQHIIQDLQNQGKVTRPALQVTLIMNVDKWLARQYNLPVDYGVVVRPIPGGAAHQAGMQDNDIIIALGDQQVRSMADLQRELFRHRVGDTITVTYIRNNEESAVSITLGELPAR